MNLTFLLLVAGGAALLAVHSAQRGLRRMHHLSKPVPVGLFLMLVVLAPVTDPPAYRWWIAAGLACSLAGDVFLMIPRDWFVRGLVAFLTAHLAYIAAFTMRTGWQGTWVVWPVLVFTVLLVGYLWPGLDKMKAPVTVYAAVIGVMGWQAVAGAIVTGDPAAVRAAYGAVLFLVSDAALAVNRFRRPFPLADSVVLGSYYLAQALISYSAWGFESNAWTLMPGG